MKCADIIAINNIYMCIYTYTHNDKLVMMSTLVQRETTSSKWRGHLSEEVGRQKGEKI